MNKQGILTLALGILIGANMVMGVWFVSVLQNPPRDAFGQTAGTDGSISVGTGKLQGRGDSDAFYLFDHNTKKLAVYAASGNRFELIAVRNTKYDWKYDEFPAKGHKPSVSDVKKQTGG